MRFVRVGLFVLGGLIALTGCGDDDGGTDAGADTDAAAACVGSEIDCGGVCVEPQTDRDHCGACGTVCGVNEVCASGACALECPAGLDICSGACADLSADRANCGACGTACDPGTVCSEGACELSCSSDLTDCDGSCRDLTSDRANCGACGTACADGEICTDGACVVSCPAGQALCDGACVDAQTDEANCGACGTVCDPGSVCLAGVCEVSCGAALSICGGACVDLNNDPANCGACGTDCSVGAPLGGAAACVAGACATFCDTGRADCNAVVSDGCETDIANSPTDCGACGVTCSTTNGVSGCAGGACTVASCDAGYADCDADVTNGCEVELTTDSANCGMCGNACTGTDLCIAGTCGSPVGDQCSNAVALTAGTNTIDWLAVSADYLTTAPSCVSVGNFEGPDVVATYTATTTGNLIITMTKSSSQRHFMVLSDSTCGTVTELGCGSEYTGTEITVSAPVTAGTTYTLYIGDTSSGSDPLPDPLTLEVTEVAQTCTPGTGGILAGTYTRVASGISSLTEYYLEADSAGWIYVGGTSDLWRYPKAGGAAQNVETAASLTTTNLGYDMATVGTEVYTLDSTTSQTGRLYRITSDGGTTWLAEDYASFATTPEDDMRAVIAAGGSLWMVTEEDTSTTDTQVWSVPVGGTAPQAATAALTISGHTDCNALAADSTYLYVACADADTIVRVPLAGGAAEVIANSIDLSATKNELIAVDTNTDGLADVLYVQAGSEEVHYVCSPTAAGIQFSGVLADWSEGGSSTTSNYGLTLEPTTGELWAWDDDTQDFIRIQ